MLNRETVFDFFRKDKPLSFKEITQLMDLSRPEASLSKGS
jgi:hypothetical protein